MINTILEVKQSIKYNYFIIVLKSLIIHIIILISLLIQEKEYKTRIETRNNCNLSVADKFE